MKSSPTMTLPNTTSTSGGLPWRQVLLAALGALVVVFAFASNGYVVTVIGFAAIYALFCTGLNFFMGFTGQASFGQNAFAALGGYGSAILTADYGFEPAVALVLSMAFSGVVALVVGYPTLRLRARAQQVEPLHKPVKPAALRALVRQRGAVTAVSRESRGRKGTSMVAE